MLNRVYKHLPRRPISGLFLSILMVSCLYGIGKPDQTFTMPEKYYRPDSSRPESSSEQLFSPSVAGEFYRIAHQTSISIDVRQPGEQEVEQAIFLLIAAANLDPRATSFAPDIINLASRNLQRDYSQILSAALAGYIDELSDIEVVRKAFRYLLEQLNSREDRENFLKEQLKKITGKNTAVESEIATMLGLLAAEKADVNDAFAYFAQAYNSNKYNRLAFQKLVELAPQQITPAAYLEHLRFLVSENPLDMQSALAFAQQSKQLGLYDTAAEAYQYCADLFNYLQPSAILPAQIYLPLAISSYNSTLYRGKCPQLARRLRQNGNVDLIVEVIAAKAAEKAGDTQQADDILREAQSKALDLVSSRRQQGAADLGADYEDLAWFYCFAVPDADKAIDFANKAYSINPNSQMAGALLAYALVSNGQNEWAKSLADNFPQNQISLIALAQIQRADGKQDLAIETLKSAIAKDSACLEAEKAKQILAELGGTYIPSSDPDVVLATLKNSLGESMGLQFVPPEKIIAVQLNVKGSKFSYGSDFGGSLTITNNSMEPLVISDDALFTGHIRIDAVVTGNIEKKMTNVVTMQIHPSVPVAPGRSMFIPLAMDSGELKTILTGHPQASLNIEFTVYLDPVTMPDGKTINRLAAIAPAKAAVSRSKIEISPRYLQNRLNSFAKGQQGQNIKTAELIIGLLIEQQDLAKGRISYKMAPADWMPTMLTSALAHNLADADWVIRVHTMAQMLPLSLDYELTNAVSENLNDTRWPCRLMAEYLLAKKQQGSFKKVLDWSAKHDPNKFVRDMAVALGGVKPPEEKPEQAEKTEPKPPAAQTPPRQTSGRITEPNSK